MDPETKTITITDEQYAIISHNVEYLKEKFSDNY